MEIPPELGRLSSLELLNLAGNDLTGEIPAELGNLSSLQRLLPSVRTTSARRIPGELGQLAGLEVLDLAESDRHGQHSARIRPAGRTGDAWTSPRTN